MSQLFSRKAIIPAWFLVVLGLFATFGAPMTLTTGAFLVFLGVVPPAIVLMFVKTPPLTLAEAIAEELRPRG